MSATATTNPLSINSFSIFVYFVCLTANVKRVERFWRTKTHKYGWYWSSLNVCYQMNIKMNAAAQYLCTHFKSNILQKEPKTECAHEHEHTHRNLPNLFNCIGCLCLYSLGWKSRIHDTLLLLLIVIISCACVRVDFINLWTFREWEALWCAKPISVQIEDGSKKGNKRQSENDEGREESYSFDF